MKKPPILLTIEEMKLISEVLDEYIVEYDLDPDYEKLKEVHLKLKTIINIRERAKWNKESLASTPKS